MAGLSPRAAASLQFALSLWAVASFATSSAAQTSDWRALGNGHRLRTVAVDGANGIAVALAFPWPQEHDAGLARGLAVAEARRRAIAADAVLPAGVRTQSEVGYGVTNYCIALDAPAVDALGPWLEALQQPTAALAPGERSDALRRDLALAALAADDSDWLYPGDRLAGSARRTVFAGSVFGTGVGGDAAALLQVADEAFAHRLEAAPEGPVFAVALGEASALRTFEGVLSAMPSPARANRASEPVPVPAAIDLATEPPLEVHPRVDAGFAAVAVRLAPLAEGGLAEVVAVEVLRRRARQRFAEFRGAEVLARAPYVQADPLGGDPLVVLHRRAPTPDFLDPAVMGGPPANFVALPHRELVDLLRDCERTPVRPEEANAALAVVRAEWAVPPYADALLGAMRRLPQAMVAPARTLCLLGRHGLGDEAVHGALRLDAMGITTALQDLARGACWHGGLVPIPPKELGG